MVKLVGPPGLSQIVKGYRIAMQPAVDAGFGRSPDPMAELEVLEVGTGLVHQDEDIKVTAVENTYYTSPVAIPAVAPKSYAYRFETAACVVMFGGPCRLQSGAVELSHEDRVPARAELTGRISAQGYTPHDRVTAATPLETRRA